MDRDDALKYEKILDAATKVIAKKGFVDTTIQAIARKAGIASGAIYQFFEKPPKMSILLSITLRFWLTINRAIEERVNQSQKSSEKLELIISILSEKLYQQEDSLYLAKTLHESIPHTFPSRNKRLNETRFKITGQNKKFVGLIDAIIKEGQESGEFANDIKPAVLRQLLYGSFEMLIYGLYLRKVSHHKDIGYTKSDIAPSVSKLIQHFSAGKTTVSNEQATFRGGDKDK